MADVTYDNNGGAGDGVWSTNTNWVGDSLPGAADNAIMQAVCTLDQNATVVDVEFQDVGSATDFTIQTGNTLTCTNISATAAETTITLEGSGSIGQTGYMHGTIHLEGTGLTGSWTVGANVPIDPETNGIMSLDVNGDADENSFTINLNGNKIFHDGYSLGYTDVYVKITNTTIDNSADDAIHLYEVPLWLDTVKFTNSTGPDILSLRYHNKHTLHLEHVDFDGQVVLQHVVGVTLYDCFIYGSSAYLQAYYGFDIRMIGGAIGYQRDNTSDPSSDYPVYSSPGNVFLIGTALNYSGRPAYCAYGGTVTIIGSNNYSGGVWTPANLDEHSYYLERDGSTNEIEAIKENATDPTIKEIDLGTAYDYYQPTEWKPTKELFWVRVKGGSTPTISVDVAIDEGSGVAATLADAVELCADIEGVFTGTEESDTAADLSTSSSDPSFTWDTLSVTLSTLPGSSIIWLPVELTWSASAANAIGYRRNFKVEDSGATGDSFGDEAPQIMGEAYIAEAGGGGIAGRGIMTGGRM